MSRRSVFIRLLVVAALVFPFGRPAAQDETVPPPENLFEDMGASGLEDLIRQTRMSLEDAKNMALANNPDLENARRDLRLAELEITRARAGYDPYVQADASYTSSKKPTSQSVFGTTNKTGSVNMSTGMSTVTGGSMSVDFRNSRSESDSVFSTLNPSYSTDLSLNVRQPLLKNRFDNTRELDITRSTNDYERARMTLENRTYELEGQVEDAYWSLVKSRMDLTLQRGSVQTTQRMHDMTRAQVRAGTSPPVATLQTEANLASAQSALIRTENDYRKTQASLKMILNMSQDDIWNLEIIPSDMPTYAAPKFDRDEFISVSMKNNLGVRQTLLNIANTEISNLEAKNRSLPQLDVRGSVGVSGLAGTDNPQDQIVETGFVVPNPLPPDQFPQPYMVERRVFEGQPSQYEGNYFDALENMAEGDNLTWSAGVTFNVPIGNRAAKVDLERARLNYEKQLDDLNNQRRQVLLNLINLVYDVEAAHRGFISARDAARLQRQNLDTEERKFSLGLNTNYEVMQARESYEESYSGQVSALIEYTKSLGRMERARKGYVSAAGSSAISLNIPSDLSGISGGGLPSGVDASMLQQYSGMLPAGVDINQLQGLLP